MDEQERDQLACRTYREKGDKLFHYFQRPLPHFTLHEEQKTA